MRFLSFFVVILRILSVSVLNMLDGSESKEMSASVIPLFISLALRSCSAFSEIAASPLIGEALSFLSSWRLFLFRSPFLPGVMVGLRLRLGTLIDIHYVYTI